MASKGGGKLCPKHNDELIAYCFDCKCLICLYCTTEEHSGHYQESTKQAVPKLKQDLREKLGSLKGVKESLSHAVGEVDATKCEVEAQVKTVTAKIESSFKELEQSLALRKHQLTREAIQKGSEKVERLYEQKKRLSASHTAIEKVVKEAEQRIEQSGDDLMLAYAEIFSQIDKDIAEWKSNEVNPVDEADFGVEVSLAKDLSKLCLSKAKLTYLVDIKLDGEGLKSADVDKTSKFSVIATLGDGKKMRRRLPLECSLKSLKSGSIVKCNIEQTDNEHHVQYQPTSRGCHEVYVSATGFDIPGSPFPVFVSMPPAQLVKPVRIIDGMEPLHVAVNSAQELVVAEPQNITIFSHEGKKISSLKIKDDHGINPFGLAVDSSDNIYVTGRQNGSYIVKLKPNLKLTKKSRKFDAEFWSLSISKDELIMVCNGKDNGIMVFDKELELVREIEVHKGLKNIRSVWYDHGKMYVCGGDCPVHIVTVDGKFLQAFSGRKSASTRGICVAGNYVYISDYATNDVLAYTIQGDYVTSFRQTSNSCNFKRPWGVSADKEGFIYICDRENKRIAVF